MASNEPDNPSHPAAPHRHPGPDPERREVTVDIPAADPDVRSLVEELQVQQIELEIQNEELRAARDQLSRSHERYRELYECAPVGYVRLDRQGHIVDANLTAAQILGADRRSLVGARLSNFIAPESQSEYDLHRRAVLADGHRHTCELTVRAEDDWRVMHVESTLAAAGADEPLGFRCVLADITARKRVEQELAELNTVLEERVRERAAEVEYREEHLRAILRTAPSAVVTVGIDGDIQQMNGAAERMFGYREADVVGRPFGTLVPNVSLEAWHRWLSGADGGEPPHTHESREVQARRADGNPVPAELAVARLSDYRMYVAILHDLTEPKRLLAEVLHAAEEERMRISVDLHDGVSQQIAGLAMTARTLARRLAAQGSSEAEAVEGFSKALNHAMEDVRQVVRDLVPLGLENENLPGALERLAETTSAYAGIECRHRCPDNADPEDEQARLQLLRIASEAVHNAVKHAGASRIEIVLERDDSGIRLSVADDGIGLSVVAEGALATAGMGLRIMRYRAQLIGAELWVESGDDGGVVVSCVLRQ